MARGPPLVTRRSPRPPPVARRGRPHQHVAHRPWLVARCSWFVARGSPLVAHRPLSAGRCSLLAIRRSLSADRGPTFALRSVVSVARRPLLRGSNGSPMCCRHERVVRSTAPRLRSAPSACWARPSCTPASRRVVRRPHPATTPLVARSSSLVTSLLVAVAAIRPSPHGSLNSVRRRDS